MASLTNKKHRLSDSSDTSTLSTLSTESTLSNNDEESCGQNQNIRVVTRVRPLSSKELNEQSSATVTALENTQTIQIAKNKNFTYDAVFGPVTSQRRVYEETAGDLLRNNLFKGFNVTVLAYGQTGSGKTHTIFGGNGNMVSNDLNEELDGIIPRAVHDVFNQMNIIVCGSDRMKVSMSYLEIYNEEAKDLLTDDPSPPDLQIRDTGGDVVVQNLSIHAVKSPSEVASLMESASDKRSTAATLMNASSSRSHAICTLYITIAPLTEQADNEEEITSKLTLVDLAGSERAKKTGAVGSRLKEGININKGLFVLGQVVSSLAELGQNTGGSDSSSIHVKYRDSKLTRLLQDSLGGNSKTVMVACVSPADSNTDETINTLRYAERTRSIKNSAVRNVVVAPLSPVEAAALRRENQILKLQLFQAQAKISSMSSTPVINKTIRVGGASLDDPMFRDNDDRQGTEGIVDNELNGLDLKDLDIVTKLKTHCTSMEERIEQLETKNNLMLDDCLDASLRADKWQMRHEALENYMTKSNIPIPEDLLVDGKTDSTLVDTLRKQIVDLQEELRDTGIDAEVSRSIAAAVLNGDGDMNKAETLAMVGCEESLVCDQKENKIVADAMSAELVAMSGSIEQKEEMIRHVHKERELMETMRSHFESAIQSLQEEVGTLSTERDTLLTRLERGTGSTGGKDESQTKKLRERTKSLESRIKELKQKAAEHRNSLKMQSQAERKCQQLQAELSADKKRRAELQRKLKKESVERRNVQKKARIDATKLLRDSQKLKLELNKVKDAAAKQENVLRRKAAEAMHRQKLLAERSKKRGRSSGSVSSDLSSQRREEIKSFIEREISNSLSLQSLLNELEDNKQMLQDANGKREVIISQQREKEESAIVRSLDGEIDLRSKISEQLEKNIGEIYKAANRTASAVEKSSSKFLEFQFWQSMSKSDVKYASQLFFSRLVDQQYNFEALKLSVTSDITDEVAKAVANERRAKEKELMIIKVKHCEDVANLLQVTKATVQTDAHTKLSSISPSDANVPIDTMLNDYLTSYNNMGIKIQNELKEVKSSQDGMKRLVDGMADEIISQNEAKAMLEAQKKKKAKKAKNIPMPEEIFDSEDEGDDGAFEDRNDSDWSPDTPIPSKKKQRTSLSDNETPESQTTKTPEQSQHDYEKMTVVELKARLRENGLTVSGKKAELVQRLKFYGSSKARDVVTASARKRARSVPRIQVPDAGVSKKTRLKSPVPPNTRRKSPTNSITLPPSSARKVPRGLTSSTKASNLRRRIPTESETAQLIRKRPVRKSPRATSSVLDTSSEADVNIKKSARSLNRNAALKKKTTSQSDALRRTRLTKKSSTVSKDSSKAPSSSDMKENRNSTDSVSTAESSVSSSTTKRNKKERPVSARRLVKTKDSRLNRGGRVITVKTARGKSGSPPRALSSITNSAKKRRTDRRQNMARSVNMALAELEKLNEAL